MHMETEGVSSQYILVQVQNLRCSNVPLDLYHANCLRLRPQFPCLQKHTYIYMCIVIQLINNQNQNCKNILSKSINIL